MTKDKKKSPKYKKKLPKYNIYKIILINHGKQLKLLCSDKTETKIMKKFNVLLKENKNVIFPKEHNNLKHVMVNADYEIMVIKVKEEGDNDISKIKDSYGKYVNYKSSNKDWIIIDRAPYLIEETFWVYGYNPKLQRKDFKWIFESFIEKDAKNKAVFKTVQIYLNKVLIEIGNNVEMVLCKNKSDARRMYNKIQELCISKKYKYIAFMGELDNSRYRFEWIKRIKKMTNWSSKKITRSSTRA